MHVVQRVPRRMQRKTYLASERQVVNNVGVGSGTRYNYSGLGEVDGMFNFGKMFSRAFTFKKHSFDFKNILGAAGSVIGTIGTGGIGQLVAPGQFGAHGKVAGFIGGTLVPVAGLLPKKFTGMTASERLGSDVALAVGLTVAGGYALAPMLPAIGGAIASGASSVGSGLMSIFSGSGSGLMSMVGKLFGGGGGQQQGGVDYGPGQPTADQLMEQARINQAQQAAYAAQTAMYQPGGYSPSIPFVGDQYAGAVAAAPSSGSYGDLRTPYTAIQEDGTQVQVNPATGQIVQAGIIPDLSPTTWLAIGGVTLVGWYFMSGSKSNN